MTTLVVDCETTGLLLPSTADLDKQPKIIELAVARIECGAVQSRHSWLIYPGELITAEITKITGLTNEDLAGQPEFRQLLPEICEAFKNADVLIAHNAPFDCGMIKNELRRCAYDGFPWPEQVVCTVIEYTHEFGRRPKLTELYERKIGRALAQTHRALDDVDALCEIVLKEGIWS